VLVAVACDAPVPDAPDPAEARALAAEACPHVARAFFYSVTKDGHTSYLLGTRHAGVGFDKLPPDVKARFGASQTLVLESVAHGALDEAPVTQTIEAQLGPELWSKYRWLVGKEPAARVNMKSPTRALAELVLMYEDTSQKLDQELEQRARAAKREVIGLEGPEETRAIGEEVIGIDHLRTILRSIRNRADIRYSTKSGLAAFCTGDTPPGAAPDGSKLAASVAQRNHAWLATLEPLLARGNVFIAVGAKHITDPGGLVDLLRKDGFTVRLEVR